MIGTALEVVWEKPDGEVINEPVRSKIMVKMSKYRFFAEHAPEIGEL